MARQSIGMSTANNAIKNIKINLFMFITAIMSNVSFNFNRVITSIISWMCLNVPDKYTPTWGPYRNAKQIKLIYATIDGENCTNRMTLMLNWYWNDDIGGFLTTDIAMPGNLVIMKYYHKHRMPRVMPKKCVICKINMRTKKFLITDLSADWEEIIFGELCF